MERRDSLLAVKKKVSVCIFIVKRSREKKKGSVAVCDSSCDMQMRDPHLSPPLLQHIIKLSSI